MNCEPGKIAKQAPEDGAAPARLTFRTDDGLNLVADAWGAPDQPPVLLAHGGGQTRHAWGGTARTLAAAGWYAITLDQRGHGDSDWSPEGNYRFEDFAGDLRLIARSLPQPPVVVGASLGGISAMIAEGEAEGPVSAAVVLVDVTPRVETKGADRVVAFMEAHIERGFATLEEAADVVAAYLPHRPRPKDLNGLKKNLRLDQDGRYRWHWDPQFIADPKRRPGAQNFERLSAAAAAMAVPVLLVRGRMSDLVSEQVADEFLALVPHARYADVSGAGHMVAGDQNDAFTDAVVEFLTDIRDGKS